VLGNKYLYLGTYATQEEAAVSYDIAAIEHRGLNAVTNFDIGHYVSHWQRHRHGHGGGSLGATDAAPVVPFQLPPPDDDSPERPAAAELDETTGAAGFHDGDDHPQRQTAACPFLGDGAQLVADRAGPPARHAAPTPSALDLLLQSPKFKEMMEQVSAAAMVEAGSNSSSSAAASSASSSASPPLSPQRQPEIRGGTAAPCGFPDDVQTFFDLENEDAMGFTFAEVDTFLFGDLGEYAAPMFQYRDLDVWSALDG